MPSGVQFQPVLRGPKRYLPVRLLEKWTNEILQERFAEALSEADPANTIAYFWPQPPVWLIDLARKRGILTVREAINSTLENASRILKLAYASSSLEQRYPITEAAIAEEKRELGMYDYVFASNPEVEKSLLKIGLAESRILRTTFGWNPARFATSPGPSNCPPRKRLRIVFAGIIGVRKGIPSLLEAWELADLDAELVLAGLPDADFSRQFRRFSRGNVRAVGYVKDLGGLFRRSDIFVFPTLEEGGPQVVYEAAACGLPVITTPMGAARLVKTGENGIVVEPGSATRLAQALTRLANDPGLRARYGANARRDAAKFSYDIVGLERRDLLLHALRSARQA